MRRSFLNHLFSNACILFLLQPGVSNSHTRIGGWIRPAICSAWTWYGREYCTTISIPVWFSLLWLWRCACGFLRCTCHHLIGFLPNIWSWTLPSVVRRPWWRWHWCCLHYSLLFPIISDFFALSSIPYASFLSARLLVRSYSSLLLPTIRSTLSEKRRLKTCLPPTEIETLWSWSVSCIILSRNGVEECCRE